MPVERILAATETKRLYAFCVTGSSESLRLAFKRLQHSPDEVIYYQALLDCMAFSDHLLARHAADLCDQLRDWLVE